MNVEYNPNNLHDFLFSQKERYKAPGNAINYVATVAEGLANPDPAGVFLSEAFANLIAVVAEHPLAESVREDHREYQWRDGELLLSAVPFRKILTDSITSSQKADFEIPRYHANLENYETLVAGRNAGDGRLFVEFSPSPELTSEAYDRGYRGNSYIGIFQTVGGVEKFTQYWFRASTRDVADMIRGLGRDIPGKVTDADILRASGFVHEQDWQRIRSFIDRRRGVVAEHREEILRYITVELKPSLEQQLGDLLKQAAEKLLQGEPVEGELQQIIDTLRVAQNKLNQRIATIGQVPIKYIYVSPEQERYLDANPFLRSVFAQKNDLPLVGCGSSVKNRDSSDPFGINDSREGETDEYGSLEFPCPKCKETVRRPRGKLLEKCPHCGASVRC